LHPGLLPGSWRKGDRLSICTAHPRGESAGPRARATVIAVPPTGYGPRRATAHTVRSTGERVGVVGCPDRGPGLYKCRGVYARRHPRAGGGPCGSGTTGESTRAGRRGARVGGGPRPHGAGARATRLTRRGGGGRAVGHPTTRRDTPPPHPGGGSLASTGLDPDEQGYIPLSSRRHGLGWEGLATCLRQAGRG